MLMLRCHDRHGEKEIVLCGMEYLPTYLWFVARVAVLGVLYANDVADAEWFWWTWRLSGVPVTAL